jgi:NADPH:quinone reductase-like Zn-dependent oxidoreductase
VPPGVSFEEAAALGIAGLSAYIPLVESIRVKAGDRVLVHAGAGGVGSFAIQIAHLAGAEVWTTCGPANADYCRGLGAARVIDYTRQDFADLGRIFDAVLDTLGGAVHRRSAEVLKPGGVLAFLNAAPRDPVTLRIPVEARYPLERGAETYELSRSGHAPGKIVLQTA